jgi:hypothetical protein
MTTNQYSLMSTLNVTSVAEKLFLFHFNKLNSISGKLVKYIWSNICESTFSVLSFMISKYRSYVSN